MCGIADPLYFISAMSNAATTIRRARKRAGITQEQLALGMGTTQSAVARLESPTSNPTLETLENAVQATGHDLRLSLRRKPAGVDETLIRRQLELTPEQRLDLLEQMYREGVKLWEIGARHRGELA
ncbi:MAG: helix-turn-helix transcriptional regulator [Actinobacteria bacterium]|nr:MAG: helix-turn-helix transcriptional regulator [Actinomycetota bacterium]